MEREPAGTTEAGLLVVVQEDIDIVDRHVPVRDALRFCLSYTLPLMHCFLKHLNWTTFWAKSPFDGPRCCSLQILMNVKITERPIAGRPPA